MVAMEHEELKELVASHALGILEPSEVELVESHLATCDECRAALADYSGVVEAIAYIAEPLPLPNGSRQRFMDVVRAEPLAMPEGSRERFMEAVRAEPVAPRQPTPISALRERQAARTPTILQRFAPLAVAAALLFMITTAALGIYTLNLNSQVSNLNGQVSSLSQQVNEIKMASGPSQSAVALLAAPKTQVHDLPGTKDAPASTARIIVNSQTNQAIFVPINLAVLPSGKQYELWLINDKGAVPAGLVMQGSNAVPLMLDNKSLGQYPQFGVSIEPTGGNTQPTGPIVIAGQIA